MTAAANTWQQVDVPLTRFGSPAQLNDLVWQDVTGVAQPTFYIDSIMLIGASSTAPAPTKVPPTATRVPPTATHVPATATRIPATAISAPTATNAPTATSLPPTSILSNGDKSISADGLAAGWSNWSWDGVYNPDATAPIHSGAKAFAVTYQSGWVGFYLHTDQAVSTHGFSALRFFVHGGNQGGQRLRFCADGQCARGSVDVAPQANTHP